MTSVLHVSGAHWTEVTRDARLVAIRWDILPRGVIFDLDVPTAESDFAPMRRGWLAFSEVRDVTIWMNRAIIPMGIWLTSELYVLTVNESVVDYSCSCTLYGADGDGFRLVREAPDVSIRAQDAVALLSQRSDLPTENRLSFESRSRLCSDQDFYSALDDLSAVEKIHLSPGF
jgi:hypothetical protein